MAPRPPVAAPARVPGPSSTTLSELDDTALRARLARRDPADWPSLLGELRRIASTTVGGFRDVCSEDDALGELALRTHERWLADWLGDPQAPPLRVFLRDRLRDHLRELRRRQGRRAALLRGAIEELDGPAVEHSEGPPARAIFASAPPRPDEVLAARELDRVAREAVSETAPLLALRAAGFDQREIAAHTGLSRPTVGRRLAAIAAVLAALTAAGGMWILLRPAQPRPVALLHAEPRSPDPVLPPPSGAPWVHEATPLPAPTPEPATPAPALEEPEPSSVAAPPSRRRPVVRDETNNETPEDSTDRELRARICLGDGDFSCVISLLEGRTRSARQLGMLIHARRVRDGVRQACAEMTDLLDRFPASSEAQRYRTLHLSQCQGR